MVKWICPETDFKKANCHTTFLCLSSHDRLVTMVFQDLITSCKEKQNFLEHIHQTLLYIIFLIDEFTTAAMLHPESSLKVYKNLASVAVCKKENKQSGNSQHWTFSVHILSPENKSTISLVLQLVTFPVRTCRFTQEARQSRSNLKTSQSLSLFP